MTAERVRVTHPRTTGARPRPRTVRAEIDAQTELGAVFMTSLLRTQLRLAAVILLAMAVLVGGLPLWFALMPWLKEFDVLGMPLPWVLLSLVVYPLLFALGWVYVRRAEHHERSFTDAVER